MLLSKLNSGQIVGVVAFMMLAFTLGTLLGATIAYDFWYEVAVKCGDV